MAIAGHSWGGYLALRALTAPSAKGAFACGIACAGIADWFCQQRHTEVRYYDYALMGGWVYEQEVEPRATEPTLAWVRVRVRSVILPWRNPDPKRKLSPNPSPSPSQVKPRAREASPLTHAAELEVPLLVLHGEDDIDVPYAQVALTLTLTLTPIPTLTLPLTL